MTNAYNRTLRDDTKSFHKIFKVDEYFYNVSHKILKMFQVILAGTLTGVQGDIRCKF